MLKMKIGPGMYMKIQGQAKKSTSQEQLVARLSVRGRQRHLATLCHPNPTRRISSSELGRAQEVGKAPLSTPSGL
jgi:hypothetical protein